MASFFNNFKNNDNLTTVASTASTPKLPKQSRKRRAPVIEDDDDDDIICTQETPSIVAAPSNVNKNDKLSEVSFQINHSVNEMMDRGEEDEEYSQNRLLMVADNPPTPIPTSPPADMATMNLSPSNPGTSSLTYVSRCEEIVPTLKDVQTPKITAFSTVSENFISEKSYYSKLIPIYYKNVKGGGRGFSFVFSKTNPVGVFSTTVSKMFRKIIFFKNHSNLL